MKDANADADADADVVTPLPDAEAVRMMQLVVLGWGLEDIAVDAGYDDGPHGIVHVIETLYAHRACIQPAIKN